MNKEAVLNNIQLAQQGDETAKELIVKNNFIFLFLKLKIYVII